MQPASNSHYLIHRLETNNEPDSSVAQITVFEFTHTNNDHSSLPLSRREIVVVQITHAGKVTLDCKQELSRENLKKLIESVKTASKLIVANGSKILELLLQQTLEKKEFLSRPALIKALNKWARLASPDDNPAFLSLAIDTGDLDLIKKLVEKGHNFNALDSSGLSLLAKAVIFRQISIVRYLISVGVQFSPIELENLWFILLGPAYNQYINDQTDFVYKNGRCIENPTCPEAMKIDLEQVRLIAEDIGPLFPKEELEKFVLYGLSRMPYLSHTNLTLFLFSQLSPALQEERFFIWERGAAIMPFSSVEFIESLIDAGGKASEFFIAAAEFGRKDILENLLCKGISIDCIDKEGNTAINIAVLSNQIDVVKFLLEKTGSLHLSQRPPAIYSRSQECNDLVQAYEPSGLSGYYFRLLMNIHCFQIDYKAEDPIFKDFVMKGFLNDIEGDIFYRLQILLNPDHMATVWHFSIHSHIRECVHDFSQFIDPIGLEKITDSLTKTSHELVAMFQKGEGFPLSTFWRNEKGPAHATFMWIEGHILFHVNASPIASEKSPGITLYTIPDRSKLTPIMIEKLRRGDQNYIEHGIFQDLDLKYLGHSSSQDQKGGFCGVRNLLLLFKGIMVLKHMQKIPSSEEFFEQFETSEKEMTQTYKKAKNGLLDLQLGKLLDLYESKNFSFKPEIPLLLMMLAKLPEESKQELQLVQFLKNHQCSIEMKSKGKNIFHYLKGERQLRLIEMLFGKEVVLNATPHLINDSNDDPPLILALKENRLESAKLLHKLGANPLKESLGDHALKRAIRMGCVDLVEQMIENLDQETVQNMFFYALKSVENEKIISSFLKAGAQVNQSNELHIFPLSYTCCHEGSLVATLLLQNGANPLLYVPGFKSSLQFALTENRPDLLELMLLFVDEFEQANVIQTLIHFSRSIAKVRAETVEVLLKNSHKVD